MDDLVGALCATVLGIVLWGAFLAFALPVIVVVVALIGIIGFAFIKLPKFAGPILWLVVMGVLCKFDFYSLKYNKVYIGAVIMIVAFFMVSAFLKYASIAISFMSSTIISLFICTLIRKGLLYLFSPIAVNIIYIVGTFIMSYVLLFLIMGGYAVDDNIRKLKGPNVLSAISAYIIFFLANLPILEAVLMLFSKFADKTMTDNLSIIIPISIVLSILETIYTVATTYKDYQAHDPIPQPTQATQRK